MSTIQVAIRATLDKRELVTFTMAEYDASAPKPGTVDAAVREDDAFTKATICKDLLKEVCRQPGTPANRVVQLIREMHPDVDVVISVVLISR